MKLVDKFKIMTYNVGFVRKSIENIMDGGLKTGDIVWLKHKYKDRFFADPFLYKKDEKFLYVLVEEFIFWEEKGKISLLKVNREDYSLVDKKTVIEEKYHLSFPFCKFGDNWIIPESINGNTTIKYYLDDDLKIIKKEVLLNEGLIDAVFYDSNAFKLIFANKRTNPKSDGYLLSMKNGHYDWVSDKPFIQDIRYSRSAGDFFEYNGILYRPVQDSTERYGRRTRIIQVSNISEDYFDFKEIVSIDSSLNLPFNETCHTFNYYGDITIVDGSKDYIRFPMKLFYKMRKKILWKKRK